MRSQGCQRRRSRMISARNPISLLIPSLEEFGQLGSHIAACLLSRLGIPTNRCPLPHARPRRVTGGCKRPQDARGLKSATRGVVRIRKTNEPASDIVKTVLGSRVDGDRRVLTRGPKNLDEADARSGWTPVIQFTRVNP